MITGDTVIRLSLKRLAENMEAVRRMAGPDVAVMAVIKANAYSHGALEVAPTLLKHGAAYLAVARLEEAMPLRQALPDAPLFVLGYTPDRLLDELSEKLGIRATIHLKLETGFNRLGTDDIDELKAICRLPHLNVEGVYSHLALKDRPSDEIQLNRFLRLVKALEDDGHVFIQTHRRQHQRSGLCRFQAGYDPSRRSAVRHEEFRER